MIGEPDLVEVALQLSRGALHEAEAYPLQDHGWALLGGGWGLALCGWQGSVQRDPSASNRRQLHGRCAGTEWQLYSYRPASPAPCLPCALLQAALASSPLRRSASTPRSTLRRSAARSTWRRVGPAGAAPLGGAAARLAQGACCPPRSTQGA